MTIPLKFTARWWPAALGSLTLFLSGLIFLPYPGIQNDEAMAASALYRDSDALFTIKAFNHDVPIMLMSYLGALKSWIYVPVFRVWRPSVYSIRVPALFFGAAAVFLFFLLLERTHGRTAALIGIAILTPDTMFLLTTCFDWGPVALQHFLTIAGVWLVVVFDQTGRRLALAGAAFCFGLALWDKALFVWMGSGLLAAAVLLFPAKWIRYLRTPHAMGLSLATGGAAFLLGCLPLVWYNVSAGFPTLHSTHGFSTHDVYAKATVLAATLDGAGLFGYLVNEDNSPKPRQPQGWLERASFWIRTAAGEHRRNGFLWALLAGLALVPFAGSAAIRTALFCLIAMVVAWWQMAITDGAGGAVHHTILLWPWPHALLAAVFAGWAARGGRWRTAVVMAGVAVLLVSDILVTNQYLYQFARDGSGGSWTDAIYGLSDGLKRSADKEIQVLDWGMTNALDALDKGRLPLRWAADPFLERKPGFEPEAPKEGVIWLEHTDDNEQFTGINAAVKSAFGEEGYDPEGVSQYYDRNGRAIFQTFRMVKKTAVRIQLGNESTAQAR